MIDLQQVTRNIVAEFIEKNPIKIKLFIGDLPVKSYLIDYEGDELILLDDPALLPPE